jgi:hypothetical protein
MPSRNVRDMDGRDWACRSDDLEHGKTPEGKDVSILCTTPSVTVPVRLTVGWQWMKMADNGLARMISAASPLPKKAAV